MNQHIYFMSHGICVYSMYDFSSMEVKVARSVSLCTGTDMLSHSIDLKFDYGPIWEQDPSGGFDQDSYS